MLTARFSLACVLAVHAAADCESEYSSYLARYPDKKPASVRSARFCDNLAYIERQNSANRGFTLGLNHFSDWTHEEFQATLGGLALNASLPEVQAALYTPPADYVPEKTVDWRKSMPAVKDQGGCPSCWAFAAVAVVDFGAAGSHSEQQTMDCSRFGCRPGLPFLALSYLLLEGSDSERAYPYRGATQSCKQSRLSPIATISHVRVIFGEGNMANAASRGVVAACINAESFHDFQHYSSGIYDSDCGSGFKEGHCVAIVGYAPSYWIIRNSWGADWGMGGYAYFKRGVNLCSIAHRGSVTATAAASSTVMV